MLEPSNVPPATGPHISILGAGIIGLSCAWELAKRGARVSIYDTSAPGRGASWAAAGMLAPAFEAAGEVGAHARLFDLCLEGAALWPAWIAELESASGHSCDYLAAGSIAVAASEEQENMLAALRSVLAARGIVHETLQIDEAISREPALSNTIHAATYLPSDSQVDNRRVLVALILFARKRSLFVDEPVTDSDIVLDARGWQVPGMLPVGGQMYSIARHEGHPRHVIRAGSVYIVPKRDRTIIGATVEPGKIVTDVSEGKLTELARTAEQICPSLASGGHVESWGGTRPATRDKAPVIGWTAPGHYVASGHYRNGILLAPLTASIVASHILDDQRSELASAFDPSRFETTSEVG